MSHLIWQIVFIPKGVEEEADANSFLGIASAMVEVGVLGEARRDHTRRCKLPLHHRTLMK